MICPKCNKEMRLVKAGVSKAGKPYKAFWSCSKECGTTFPFVEQEIEIVPDIKSRIAEQINNIETILIGKTLSVEDIDNKLIKIEERFDKLIEWIKTNIK